MHEFIGSDSNFDKLNFNSWHEQACWQYFRLIKHNAEWLNQECERKANWHSIVHLITISSVALSHKISVKHDIEIAKTMMMIGYEDKMVASASSDESNFTNAIENVQNRLWKAGYDFRESNINIFIFYIFKIFFFDLCCLALTICSFMA